MAPHFSYLGQSVQAKNDIQADLIIDHNLGIFVTELLYLV